MRRRESGSPRAEGPSARLVENTIRTDVGFSFFRPVQHDLDQGRGAGAAPDTAVPHVTTIRNFLPSSVVSLLRSIPAPESTYASKRINKSGDATQVSGGVDGTRTRGLRRDRPAF